MKPSKLNFFSKVILDSDIIVYDLNTCDLDEAALAIKSTQNLSLILPALKNGQYEEQKVLICISTVMVWSNTPFKEKVHRTILSKSRSKTHRKMKSPKKESMKSRLVRAKKKQKQPTSLKRPWKARRSLPQRRCT